MMSRNDPTDGSSHGGDDIHQNLCLLCQDTSTHLKEQNLTIFPPFLVRLPSHRGSVGIVVGFLIGLSTAQETTSTIFVDAPKAGKINSQNELGAARCL